MLGSGVAQEEAEKKSRHEVDVEEPDEVHVDVVEEYDVPMAAGTSPQARPEQPAPARAAFPLRHLHHAVSDYVPSSPRTQITINQQARTTK